MKILQLVSGTDVNGALVHCRLLSRELSKRGHDITIACRPNCWLWNQMDDSLVRLVTCGMKRWPWSGVQKFARWIRRQGFDVMHSHMSSAHMFGLILKRLTGVPVVATAHSRHVQPHWRWNDHVIANSESTARYMRLFNQVKRKRISTVHCFIDTDKFREPEKIIYQGLRRQWRFQPNTKVLMVAGDVIPNKGHWYLFQALPEIAERHPNLKVVVVGRFKRGEAYTQKLRDYLVHNQLFKRVKWIGRRNNMHEMLGAADLVAIPSIVESLGLVALECMAVGTPVIAARTGGLSELIDHEQNGLLVPARKPQAISAAISRLLDDETLRFQLIEGGKSVLRNQFSVANLTNKIESILSRVSTNAKRAARSALSDLNNAA